MAEADQTIIGKTGKQGKRGPGRPTLSNEELLDAALDLFLENGFDRTSIEGICSAAGMAKRTIYARYGDKTNLFKQALTRAIGQWIVPIERLREAETDDLEETLLAIGRILLANLLSPAGLRLLRLTNSESGRMPEIGVTNVRQGTEPTIKYLSDLLRRRLGDENGELPDADDAAAAFLHLVVGGPTINAAWGVALAEDDIARHARYCVHLMLHGLLPTDSRTREIEDENRRLKSLLGQSLIDLDRARGLLAQAIEKD